MGGGKRKGRMRARAGGGQRRMREWVLGKGLEEVTAGEDSGRKTYVGRLKRAWERHGVSTGKRQDDMKPGRIQEGVLNGSGHGLIGHVSLDVSDSEQYYIVIRSACRTGRKWSACERCERFSMTRELVSCDAVRPGAVI